MGPCDCGIPENPAVLKEGWVLAGFPQLPQKVSLAPSWFPQYWQKAKSRLPIWDSASNRI